MNDTAPAFPFRLESPSGLAFLINANGSVRRMDHRDVSLNLFPGNEFEGGPCNLWLRLPGSSPAAVPLLGPKSPGRAAFGAQGFSVAGEWRDLRYTVYLVLAESAAAWFWHVALENAGTAPATVDLVYTQDLALASYAAVRSNEYYVSQYLDHQPLEHPERGWVVATRQNLGVGGRTPWCLVGALGRGESFATDALQVHGFATRAGRCPEGVAEGLPGARRQHEHAMAAIQDAPVTLEPGARVERGFFGWFEADHPEASSEADLARVGHALALPEARFPAGRPAGHHAGSPGNLFSAPLLEARELSEAEISGLFGAARHGVETGEDGRLLSFFTGERRHVVLKAKETLILRPHGHILRTGSALLADEAALTSTAWMCGVFHSMCTQGHVSINRFLSTHRSYLGLYRSHGLRLFVRQVEGWRLLDLPSAFEMAPEGCRWIYRHGEGLLEVRAGAATDRHELTLEINVLSGSPLQVLLTAHLAVNGDDGAEAVPARVDPDGAGVLVRAIPESDLGRRFPEGGFYLGPRPDTLILQRGGDELLFGDGDSRGQPVVCFVAAPALSLGFSILGRLVPEPHPDAAAPTADRYWRAMTAGLRLAPPADSPLAEDARCLADILPWFVHNGLVHYLSPRGLEQYSGGGWGARDVTQGPVELLLGLGRPEPIRDILRKVFRQQNPDGDWPQWFMFFERERNIRPNDSHGDIVFWPVLALGQYLVAADDPDLLDEEVPFFHPEGEAAAERASFWGHVERALGVIERRAIPGTRLAAYGHGDWNDSLQPADPSFRDSLCSSWTVTLHYRTLHFLAAALRKLGREEPAARLETWAAAVLADFQKLLVADGVLAGFAHFGGEGVRYLLHPEDRDTGLSYSLLPMIHAIIDGLFSPGQARHHLGLIERELLGPDGARLFDRPMAYRGGPQRFFQRAESSSFFGREIGLMYMHAHLRYAEALWQFGDAEGFFRALRLAVPIGLEAHVPSAARRQANCYYSSSDAAFRDRYQAHDEYGLCLSGEIPLEGGWRVYSSGAGISTGLIFRCFLGMRAEASRLVIDPAVPKELDGLKAELELRGIRFEVTYRVEGQGCGPVALELNGRDLPFTRLSNPYRPGGAEVAMDAIRAGVLEGVNLLTVRLG